MQKRFHGLSILAVLLKIIGGISLLIAFVGLIMLPLVFSENDGVFANLGFYDAVPGTGLIGGLAAGVLVFIISGLVGTVILAVGGMTEVLIAIEENTRASVILTQSGKLD